MTLYRVLRTLQVSESRTIPAGDFLLSDEHKQTTLDKLEEVGAIGILHAPPLSELPGFDAAEQLATIGIVNADQLLEMPSEKIAERLSVDRTTVLQWRADVSNWLIIPVRAGG